MEIFALMGLGAILLLVAQVNMALATKLAGGLAFCLFVWMVAESIRMMNGDDDASGPPAQD